MKLEQVIVSPVEDDKAVKDTVAKCWDQFLTHTPQEVVSILSQLVLLSTEQNTHLVQQAKELTQHLESTGANLRNLNPVLQ